MRRLVSEAHCSVSSVRIPPSTNSSRRARQAIQTKPKAKFLASFWLRPGRMRPTRNPEEREAAIQAMKNPMRPTKPAMTNPSGRAVERGDPHVVQVRP